MFIVNMEGRSRIAAFLELLFYIRPLRKQPPTFCCCLSDWAALHLQMRDPSSFSLPSPLQILQHSASFHAHAFKEIFAPLKIWNC